VTYHFAVDGTRLQDDGLSYDAFGQFTLTYNFTTLQINTPTNRAVFSEGAPILLQITSPLEPLDGNVTDMNLIATSLFRLPELHPLSNTSPSTVLSNFPPDFYSLAVVATNSDRRMLAAAPVSITVRPKNDRFADRVPLLGAMTSASGWISASSLETGEQSRWEQGIVGSVWWTWIAPASGRFAMVSDRSLRAFTGTSMPSLSLVANSPNGYTSFNVPNRLRNQCGGLFSSGVSRHTSHLSFARERPVCSTDTGCHKSGE
jgi:hypothetical protein